MTTIEPRLAGRDVNDADAIVIEHSDVDEVLHTIRQESDVLFTWDYERSRPALVQLYEKAKRSQWNATTDLPWDTEVDNDKLAADLTTTTARFDVMHEADDAPTAHSRATRVAANSPSSAEVDPFAVPSW